MSLIDTVYPPTVAGAAVPVEVVKRRITHLKDACAFINETIMTHKDPAAFQSIVDWAIQSCEIEPVQLAKAFEVSTGTVSRWRAGKNAPHPRERPRVIAWMKEKIGERIRQLEEDIAPPDHSQTQSLRYAAM
jgi:hypothetical protein